ncbi:hypothetical protein COCVIDRAFT_114247 [Bipolaris victoriae FI3]|uniref:Uncharacterized protein n=1 Tax=Bipolaris victoriae (strain FI3) TaxID=930091 RepID=W7E2J2_BIPV3|nr:hypothetical protein COCVIDRAFT_114247 [Bipolaris victoriae FI3]
MLVPTPSARSQVPHEATYPIVSPITHHHGTSAARHAQITLLHVRPQRTASSSSSPSLPLPLPHYLADTAAIHFCSSCLSKCSSMPSTGMSCCWYLRSRCSRNCSSTFFRYT